VASKLLKGLPPIIDERARVLILGSFPSEASLAAQQYYAHRQNQFWKILGAVLDQPLAGMDYATKQAAVKTAGIAIWDVYAACERAGSLDSAIRNGQPNDFMRLNMEMCAGRRSQNSVPQGHFLRGVLAGRCGIQRVCFNGQAAGKFAPQLEAQGFATLILPSTSPANATWSFERKLAAWREGLGISQVVRI
jgi:hypoxanthine-DNA glycosylase